MNVFTPGQFVTVLDHEGQDEEAATVVSQHGDTVTVDLYNRFEEPNFIARRDFDVAFIYAE